MNFDKMYIPIVYIVTISCFVWSLFHDDSLESKVTKFCGTPMKQLKIYQEKTFEVYVVCTDGREGVFTK